MAQVTPLVLDSLKYSHWWLSKFSLCSFNFFLLQLSNDEPPMGMAVGMPDVKNLPAAVDLAKNPLADTHEFRQACAMCYVKTGKKRSIPWHLVTEWKTLRVKTPSPHLQVLECWITRFTQKSINAKRMYYSAEWSTRPTKCGSSFDPDQRKLSMSDRITSAKVTSLSWKHNGPEHSHWHYSGFETSVLNKVFIWKDKKKNPPLYHVNQIIKQTVRSLRKHIYY